MRGQVSGFLVYFRGREENASRLKGERGIVRKRRAKKRILSIILTMALVLILIPMDVFTLKASAAITGNGTAENPYLISSLDDWKTFADNVNNGTRSYEGEYVKLTADIDGINEDWMVGTSENKFKGTFLGGGHTIDVLLNSDKQGTAPFSYVEGATINCLNVTGSIPLCNKNAYHASGLVGFADGVTISNCHVSVDIEFYPYGEGNRYSGGIIGHAKSSPFTMTDCLFDGSFSYSFNSGQMFNVGGLVGWDDASTPNITNCLNAGTFANSGVISKIARVDGRGIIENCFSTINATSEGDHNDNRGTYTTATGESLREQLGSGWEISNNKVVPIMNPGNLATATISGLADNYYTYTGSPIAVNYSVSDVNGKTLICGTDYNATIRDSSNQIVTDVIDKGKYTLTVTAKTGSGYSGSQTVSFRVVNCPEGLSVDISCPEQQVNYYYVNMPKTGNTTVTLTDAGVTAFKVYDDGGRFKNYSKGCDGTLTLTAPEDYALWISGNVRTQYHWDYMNVYDGSDTGAKCLLYEVNSTTDDVETAITPVISTGRSLTIYFHSGGDNYNYAGLDLTVILFKPDAELNINVGTVTGGTVAASVGDTAVTTAKVDQTVTLTATPESSYLLSNVSVEDANGNAIAVDVNSFANTATFRMPATAVTVTPTFTSTLTADGGLYVNIPKTGEKTVTIPSGVQSFKVYDHGGYGGEYGDNCSGALTLTAPMGYVLQLSGNITLGEDDKLTVYDGNGTGGNKLLDGVTSSYYGVSTPITTVVSSGQSMTLYFKSDSFRNYAGLDLTVKIIVDDADHEIIINTATGGTIAASVSDTLVTMAGVNQIVTLTATPGSGYILSNVSVKAGSNDVDVDVDFSTNTATFCMPATIVTVTPMFTNTLTAGGGLYVNMPKTGEKTVAIPSDVQSFKVYDDGGRDGNYSESCSGTLTLTAPTGYILRLSGNIMVEPTDDKLTVYDGNGTSGNKLLNEVASSGDGDTQTAIATVVSSGTSMTICFYSNNLNNYAGLDLTVTLIPITYTISFNANGGSGDAMAAQSFTYDIAKKLTANTYSRTGYTFDGWATKADGNVAYTDEQNVCNLILNQGANVELFAHWTVISYNVTYNGVDDATFTAANPTTYTVKSNDITLNNPSKTGYTFAGWYENAGFEGQAITGVAIATGSTGGKTFYAKWKKLLTNVDITVESIADQTYTGNAITPAVVVKDGETDITDQCDISFSKNTEEGTATVTIAAKAKSAGYAGTTTATFKIIIYEVTVPTSANRVYTGEVQTGVAAGTGYSLTNDTATAAGNYTATATLDIGYRWSDGTTAVKEISWSISRKAVTVKADDKSILKGETDPEFTATVTGLVEGESESLISYQINRAAGTAVGSYVITPSGAATQGNYAVTYETGTLTIAPAEGNCGAEGHESDVKWSFQGGTLTISKAENAATGAMASYERNDENLPWRSMQSDITSVVIGEGVTHVGNYAFNGCTEFTAVTIPASVETIGKGAFFTSGNISENHLANVTFAPGSKCKTIGDYAFECLPITSVEIPASVTSIGEVAFGLSDTLESVSYTGTGLSIGNSAFDCCRNLSDFPFEGVTSIGKNAFEFTALTSVAFSDVLTSIDERAFQGCEALTSVVISGSGMATIGDRAFCPCKNLKTVEISGVKSIGYQAFQGCYALETLTITGCDAGMSIGNAAFQDDHKLANLTLKGVSTIENNAFNSCKALEAVEIPDGVTSIGYCAFECCDKLAFVLLPPSVMSVGERAFGYSKQAMNVYSHYTLTLGEDQFNTDNMDKTTIHYYSKVVFGDHINVTGTAMTPDSLSKNGYFAEGDTITIAPEKGYILTGVTATSSGNSLTVESNAFTMPKSDVTVRATVTIAPTEGNCGAKGHESDVKWSFQGGTLTISKAENAATGAMADYTFGDESLPWRYWQSDITSVVIGEGVTHIGDYAFNGCTNFASVTIPASVETIGEGAFFTSGNISENHLASVTFAPNSKCKTIGDYAFEFLPIASVELPAAVTSIGKEAFGYSNTLESVSYTGTGLSIGNSAFDCCRNLSDFPFEGVTSIGFYAFESTALTSVAFSDALISIDFGAFQNCEALMSVVISGNGMTTVGEQAFYYCKNLKTAEITGVKSIGIHSFQGCSVLETLTITGCDAGTSIELGAFEDCHVLANLTLKGVSTIGESAFIYCYALESVEIPDGVTSIGQGAFDDCHDLAFVILPPSVTNVGEEAFIDSWQAMMTVYAPSTLTLGEDQFEMESTTIHYYSKVASGNHVTATGTAMTPDVLSKKNYFAEGDTVTIAPEKGYTLTGVTATSGGNSLTVVNNAFTMPGGDVNVTAIAEEIKVTGVMLGQTDLSLNIGGTATLKATVAPENALPKYSELVWTSSNENVATVDENGKVTAIAEGTATITATAKNEADTAADDKTATCKVTVLKIDGPAAPTGLTGVVPTTDGGSDGKITGVDGSMEYAGNSGFTSAKNCTGTEITGLTAGTYYVRVKETETHKAGATATVVVPAYYDVYAKVKKAPAAKTDLLYNGTAQALVIAGEAENGTMQYALGTNATTAPTTGWSTSVPAATNAGTYYVWYMVKGDPNHNDTSAEYVTVEIKEADKEDLNKAISGSEDFLESIIDNDDYTEIADELEKAIEEAKKIVTNKNVTSEQIADAIKNLTDALDAASEKKQAVDKDNYEEAKDTAKTKADSKAETNESEACKKLIEDAKKALDGLTYDVAKTPEGNQEAIDAILDDLSEKLEAQRAAEKKAAEEEAAKKKEEEDSAAAKKVEETINALPSSDKVAVTDKEAIEAARKAYDALTEDQKAKVPAETLKKLEAAEKALDAAEKKASDETDKKASDDSDKDAEKPDYENEWVDGQWYGADGNTDYTGIGAWKSNETGWWYEDTTGWYPVSQWQKIDGKWYYFTADGYMDYSEYRDGCWLGSDGAWDETYGGGHWMTNGTGWWYEDDADWYPVNQWLWIDGSCYYFYDTGYMATNTYVGSNWVNANGAWE